VPGDLILPYLADLGRRLPPGIVDEIADGLAEACEHHLARGLTEKDAAQPPSPSSETPGSWPPNSPGRRRAAAPPG
jgi:hypothetical protein